MHVRVKMTEEEKRRIERIWGQSVDTPSRVLDMIRGPLYDYYVIWLPEHRIIVRCPAEWVNNRPCRPTIDIYIVALRAKSRAKAETQRDRL